MNYNLLAKVAIAGAVLTGVTGTAVMGNIVGVNQEAKAQVAQPNAEHFKKTVDGKEIDLTDTLNKDRLTAKELSDAIKQKLEDVGINYKDYKFNFKIKDTSGGIISGGGDVGETPSNQEQPFNPSAEPFEYFNIEHK